MNHRGQTNTPDKSSQNYDKTTKIARLAQVVSSV